MKGIYALNYNIIFMFFIYLLESKKDTQLSNTDNFLNIIIFFRSERSLAKSLTKFIIVSNMYFYKFSIYE